jgi:signal transduction histidine kinase
MWKWLRHRFGTLRWKLASSYVLVTLLVVLTLEALLLLVTGGLISVFYPRIGGLITDDLATSLRPAFEAPDRSPKQLGQQLVALLEQQGNGQQQGVSVSLSPLDAQPAGPPTNATDEGGVAVFTLLDEGGHVLTSTLPLNHPTGAVLGEIEPMPASSIVERALGGETNVAQLSAWSTGSRQPFAVAPVLGDNGQVLGAVYARFPPTSFLDYARGFATVLGVSSIAILFSSGFIGLFFGLIAGRGLSRRLKRLTAASAAMAGGDLSRRVEDGSADEIGQLARQFNTMAAQLAENMRALRLLADQNAQLAEQATQLATVEERNRLARDLHDSVSQELFSLTMQAAAAQRLLRTKPELAATHLQEIQTTAQQALQETRSLIFALRPAQLDDRGLGAALRDLRTAAKERQGLLIDLRISGERRLPLEHEQALFRIVQEGLANVVRHSGERAAEVDLQYSDEEVCLTVCDHGRGFDPAAPRNARSIGLDSMSERATALGGTVTVDSALGQGTTVAVCLPAPAPPLQPVTDEPQRRRGNDER